MNLNQIARMQMLKKHLDAFRKNRPKFPAFVDAVWRNAMEEDTVIEISVTTPHGQNYVTNLKLKKEDLDFLQEIRELKQ